MPLNILLIVDPELPVEPDWSFTARMYAQIDYHVQYKLSCADRSLHSTCLINP